MGTTSPRETLNLRIRPELRGLIDRAAAAQGKTRTDFVLEASRRAAEEALLERVVFAVEEPVYRQFLERLDAPPKPNARIKATMRTPAPWENT